MLTRSDWVAAAWEERGTYRLAKREAKRSYRKAMTIADQEYEDALYKARKRCEAIKDEMGLTR